jgi:CRP-like cAMP-binding protein
LDLIRTIRQSALFQSFEDKAVESLASHCRQRKLDKGQELFAMGDEASAFFIIQKGWIKLYRISREAEETIIHVFGPGESFAEAAVFSDRKIYPVNAQAVEDVELIEIPRNYFIHKIEEDSRFALRMLGAIAARQHYLVQQLEQVTNRTAPQRIGAFLLRFCRREPGTKEGALTVNLPYDKSIISRRLNIKAETFSRALAKLGPHGVEANGRLILIKKPESLAKFCEVELKDTPC